MLASMSTIDLTLENFEEKVAAEGIVLVDFWADWCGPCKMFAPIYDEAAKRHPSVTFGKVDTEDQQQLAASFQIQSIPTIMAFRDGVGLFSQPGVMQAEQLDTLIEQIEKLDMEEVHRQVAEQQQQARGQSEAASNDSE